MENLEKLLTTNFEKGLFKEAKNNLNFDSKIRFSNFAYAMRELIDIMLINKAPDEKVIRCPWYIDPKPTPTNPNPRNVNRRDRIKYIIQGGISDKTVEFIFDINFQNKIQQINKYFRDTLSAHVHINEAAFDYSNEIVSKKVEEFSQIFRIFWDMVQNIRNDLIKVLEEDLNEIVTDVFLQETFDALDCLSTHTTVDEVYIDDIQIKNITECNLEVHIDGNVGAEFQYGSDGDLEREIGDIMDDRYPFEINFDIDISDFDSYFNFEDYDLEDESLINEFKEEFKKILVDKIEICENNISIDTDSFYQ